MLYYLSLGANLGDREQTIRQALTMIEQHIGPVLRCSSFYYSAPWGFQSEHEFCNVCCSIETTMEPLDVLRATQAIERALGRTKKSTDACEQTPVYTDRTIDIDLIRAWDEKGKEILCDITNEGKETGQVSLLTLPHPLWKERDFVKVPLAEIALAM